ncbi:MAG: hypothetical protein G01um101438_394 [Parcubacteria group bacterium Gr01-1014_38]|nr:MAG: hypothetical protein G01um101438_394 [Parcubacteria group bacterium Gr01-1014_38]
MFSRWQTTNTARTSISAVLGMLLVGGIAWAMFSVTVAHGAETCSLEEVQSDIANGSITLNLTDAAVTVTNSAGCAVPIRLEIYRVFRPDPPLLYLTQVPVDIQEPTLIQPGETKTITGNIPPCAYQIDAAYGPFAGPHLAGRIVTRGGFCPPLVNNASCVSVDVPRTVQLGQEFQARVTLQNTGTRPWHASPIISPHRLGSRNPTDNLTWGVRRIELPVFQVAPGGLASFIFTARAPSTAGTYSFAWGMLEELLEHFGAPCESAITVVAATSTSSLTPTPLPTSTATPSPTPGVLTLVQVIQGQTTVVNVPTPAPVEPTSMPRLTAIVKTDQRDTVAPGEFLTYRITLKNDGDAPATNLRIVDRVPQHLRPDPNSITPAGADDAATRTIVWDAKTIPPHTIKRFTFSAQVDPAAPHGFIIRNAVEAVAPGFSASAADTTTVSAPRVKGAITVSAPRAVPLGVETGMDAKTLLLTFGGMLSGIGAYLFKKSA